MTNYNMDRMVSYVRRRLNPEDVSEPTERFVDAVARSTRRPNPDIDFWRLKADIAASESCRDFSEQLKKVWDAYFPEVRYQSYDDRNNFITDFVEVRNEEDELSVGDASSLVKFIGEFTVSKRVGEV